MPSKHSKGLDQGICLHGHTHLPTVFHAKASGEITMQVPTPGEPIDLDFAP